MRGTTVIFKPHMKSFDIIFDVFLQKKDYEIFCKENIFLHICLYIIVLYLNLFSSRCIWKQVLLFMGTCSKFYFPHFYDFYLITVLICYLYFIIYRRAHNIFEIMWWFLFWPSFLLLALNVTRNGLFQEHYALCDGVLQWFQFLRNAV